ncbi:sensor histidine kinase [Paenibacillus xanthanilyticus]
MSSFFVNISLMLFLMYMASLVYKYAIFRCSARTKEVLFIALAIFAGWGAMHYGVQLSESVRLDMRILPLIVAPMFVRSRLSIVMIGVGIGLARLTFGLQAAAWVGFVNLSLMGVLLAALMQLLESKRFSFAKRMTAVILAMNTWNVLFLSVFGVMPTMEYLSDVVPPTYALSLSYGFLFVFVLREFIVEAGRKEALEQANAKLRDQYRIAEERSSELALAKLALEDTNEQLRRSSQYKTDFLANMSHELRTPLNSMIVFSQLLEENAEARFSPEEVRYAGIIRSSGEQLLSMINDVLDLSRVDAGRMELEFDVQSIAEIVQQLEYVFGSLAGQKGLAFATRVEDAVPEFLRTDGRRLYQILQNLLANALKFTESGEVRLTVGLAGLIHGQAGVREVVFAVEDTGIGIAADKQAYIFEAFRQADGSTSRLYGGSGLGLAISQRFAHMLGGRIEVASEEGRGSRFTLHMPLPAPEGAAAARLPVVPGSR